MKYYIVRQPSDPKIMGVRDGGSQAEIDRKGFIDKSNYDRFNEKFFDFKKQSFWEILEEGIPDLEFTLECVKLREGAKITDFLSYYPNLYFGGKFLLSEKAFNILTQFNLPKYKCFPAKLIADQKSYQYKLLFTPVIANNINFHETTFFTGNKLRGKKFFHLNSLEEFKRKKDIDIFQTDKVVFNRLFNKNLDYFISIVSIPTIFISERLKAAIEENSLTGLSVLEDATPSIEIQQ